VPATLARGDNGRIVIGTGPEHNEIVPNWTRKNNGVRLPAFAKERNLPGIAVDLDV
jgi:hypothetical protein